MGGDPDKVLQAPVTTVLHILNFTHFETDFEKEYDNLNITED